MTAPAPSNLTIRNMDLAGVEGAALCSAIHKEAFSPLDEDGWSVQAIAELMASSGVHILLAYRCDENRGETPAGFALYRTVAGEAELITLATRPHFQGQGVAHALMREMLFRLENEGVEKLFLEVRSDNLRAVKLYSDLGFEKIGKRQKYYKTRSGNLIDALCLALFLKTVRDRQEI